jgi:FtsZ-interacting cell division protein YlmF
MSGCYQYTGMPNSESDKDYQEQNEKQQEQDYYDNEEKKRRRKRNTKTTTNNKAKNYKSFCNRYAKLDTSLECNVILILIQNFFVAQLL